MLQKAAEDAGQNSRSRDHTGERRPQSPLAGSAGGATWPDTDVEPFPLLLASFSLATTSTSSTPISPESFRSLPPRASSSLSLHTHPPDIPQWPTKLRASSSSPRSSSRTASSSSTSARSVRPMRPIAMRRIYGLALAIVPMSIHSRLDTPSQPQSSLVQQLQHRL